MAGIELPVWGCGTRRLRPHRGVRVVASTSWRLGRSVRRSTPWRERRSRRMTTAGASCGTRPFPVDRRDPLVWREPRAAYTQRADARRLDHPTTPRRLIHGAGCVPVQRDPTVILDPADIEQIAQRVADLLAATHTQPTGQFVDAAQLAQLLGVERDWFYAHANALGAIRLGGPRGRLRFDLQRVRDAWREPPAGARTGSARRRSKRSRATRGRLIPYESEPPGRMTPVGNEGNA